MYTSILFTFASNPIQQVFISRVDSSSSRTEDMNQLLFSESSKVVDLARAISQSVVLLLKLDFSIQEAKHLATSNLITVVSS